MLHNQILAMCEKQYAIQKEPQHTAHSTQHIAYTSPNTRHTQRSETHPPMTLGSVAHAPRPHSIANSFTYGLNSVFSGSNPRPQPHA